MNFKMKAMHVAVAVALATGSAGAFAQYTGGLFQGPSSSATPYNQGIAGIDITSILTTGDSVGGYRMGGIPDGLGAYDNGNGTFTVLMNHELGNTVGVARAHGGIGAYVSEWVVNKSTLAVVSGNDLITSVIGWNNGTSASNPGSSGSVLSGVSFNRFCSADLAPTSAFYNAATGLGTQERIFMHGEEGGSRGWQMATVATGTDKGKSYVLGGFNLATNGSGINAVGGWENALANPLASNKTIVIGNNDGGTGIMSNSVALYVGTKTNTGSVVDRAGLTNGTVGFVNVAGNAAEIANATTRTTNITNGTAFTIGASSSTTFSRPEDGSWSKDGTKYYFVTTDRIDQTELTGGTQKGSTRLWRLNFSKDSSGEIITTGGTIDLVIDGGSFADGSGKPNMFDNLVVNDDGTITIQEDTGNAAHNGKMWHFDPATGTFKIINRSDPTRFGDVVAGAFVAGSGQLTQDEETSGVIDVTAIMDPAGTSGKRYNLFVMQNHAGATGPNATELVEGGQLQLMTTPVPEPSTYAMMLAGLAGIGSIVRRRRQKKAA